MKIAVDTIIPLTEPRGFIVLEGPNGAGKSTLLKGLHNYFSGLGHVVLSTFEPGDSPYGKLLRSILLSQSTPKLEPLSELLLFATDRHEHIQKVILPALQRNEIVLCDRYIFSTLAFQGFGRGLPLRTINELNELSTAGLAPDVVLLLDCPPEVGLKRTQARTDQGPDSFEGEQLAFHTRLREGFLALAEQRPEPFLVLDAEQSPDQVLQQSIQVIERLGIRCKL